MISSRVLCMAHATVRAYTGGLAVSERQKGVGGGFCCAVRRFKGGVREGGCHLNEVQLPSLMMNG